MTKRFRFGARSVIRRCLVPAILLALGSLAIGSGLEWFHASGIAADVAVSSERAGTERAPDGVTSVALPAVAEAAAAFPLVVQPGKRHLLDSAGKPFLIQGE